jgi:hypothetical protein
MPVPKPRRVRAVFNTLKYATMMEEVGFSRTEAETSVKIWVEIMEDNLASKQDIQELKQDMLDLAAATKQDLKDHAATTKQDISDLRTELQQEIHDLATVMNENFLKLGKEIQACELRLTVRMGAVAVAIIGILTAIQKLA